MRTIIWYVGKVKSYLAAERDAEIRTHRKKFMEAVCREYGMQPRRLPEGLQVYKKYAALPHHTANDPNILIIRGDDSRR